MTHDPMRQADVARRLANMAKARRCGAKTRAGHACRQAAVRNARRCRMHGGAKGSGGLQASATDGSSTGSTRARPKRSAGSCEKRFGRLWPWFKQPTRPARTDLRHSGARRGCPTSGPRGPTQFEINPGIMMRPDLGTLGECQRAGRTRAAEHADQG